MTTLSRRRFLTASASAALGGMTARSLASDRGQATPVGLAQIDVTPGYAVRLSGFGGRRTENEGVTQRIRVKAMAIGDDARNPAVLITADNLGVSDEITETVAARLKAKAGIAREQIAVSCSHTHTAPMLTNVAPTLFGLPIPPDHQERIDRYTGELTESLVEVALAALEDRKPARLSWTVGKVGFAYNRRTKGGPVDHELPVLFVKDLSGNLRAVYASYACHCVTLRDNKISGDWAGYAQERIQKDHPGATGMVAIGCGADQNPNCGERGFRPEVAAEQGAEIAAEVRRLLAGELAPVAGAPVGRIQRIDIPFDALPTRAQWEERVKGGGPIGYHAQVQLARLDRGEALQTKLDYPIQTLSFGDSLAMVFLAGEVVVDYSLRLKRELDHKRIWINAYSNDLPCYIPSERILREGGYEGGGAMVYFDRPTRLKPGLEQPILDAIHGQLGDTFKAV